MSLNINDIENEADENIEFCRNKVLSEEYYDFIVEYTKVAREVREELGLYCLQSIGSKYGVVYPKASLVEPLSFEEYTYVAIPKLYGLMDSSAVIDSGAVRLQNQSNLNLKGQGVLVGFVDTGIDIYNKAFRTSSGQSRIWSIWDQTIQTGTPPEGFFYGTEFTNDQINDFIDEENTSDSLTEITKDEIGHGTAMAALAAGSNDEINDFVGAAPLSMIVVVKLKQAKQSLRDFYFISEDAVAYEENDVMLALRYLRDVSNKTGKPMSIAIGIGTNQGDHAGNGPLGDLIDTFSQMAKMVTVIAGGNEGDKRHHFYGQIPSDGGSVTAQINVGQNENGFAMELWGDSPDIYTMNIVSPSGERSPTIGTGIKGSEEINFIFDSTVIYTDFRIVEAGSGKELIIARFQNPTPGIWSVEVNGANIIRGIFNIWLPIDTFISRDTYFLESNPEMTITEPGNALTPITVSGYNNINNSLYVAGSRGYNKNGYVKPELAAPAVNISVPSVIPVGGDRFVDRSGTSLAAAITAGVAAQFLTWGVVNGNQPIMKTQDVKNYLIRGARRSPLQTYPNREWGYGILDGYNAFEVLIR